MSQVNKKKVLPFSVFGFFIIVAFLLAEANFVVYLALTDIFNISYLGKSIVILFKSFVKIKSVSPKAAINPKVPRIILNRR